MRRLAVLVTICFSLLSGYGLPGSPAGDGLFSVSSGNTVLAATLSDHHHPAGEPAPEVSEETAQPRHTHTVYICPMNCVEPMDQPGRCPVCGMNLVPKEVEPDSADNHPSKITFSEEMVKTVNIRVAPVEQKYLSTDIRLYGKIEYDPVEQYKVTAYAPGVIDNIYVKRAGQIVRIGDPLFDLNSAELYYLEQEFFEVLEKLPYELDLRPGKFHSRKRVGRWTRLLLPQKEGAEGAPLSQEENQAIQKELDQIKRKMRLLGLSDSDIEGLIVKGRPTGIATITTPMTGVVLEQNAYRGTFVNTGDVIFTVANPRVLWARLDAYASDFPWIRLGQDAEFTTDAYPGQTFKGKVLYLDPEFDQKRGAFKVGVLYQDERNLLKPNMLVRCSIQAKLTSGGRSATEVVTQGMMGTAQFKRTDTAPLVIPDTAPLITGKRAIVYVQAPGQAGTYVGREVVLGPRGDGHYIVNEGLHKDEMVVVNGNFKIDSAIQILAKPSMMSHPGSELAMDDYRHVQTPPLPKELQGEPSDKGAKYEHFGNHGQPPPGPADLPPSPHKPHQRM